MDLISGYYDIGNLVVNFGCYFSPHCFVSRRERNIVKVVYGVIIILANWKDHFIREGENMVQHPNNYIWSKIYIYN